MITKDPADELCVILPEQAAFIEAVTERYRQAWSEVVALTLFNELPEWPSRRRRE